MANAKIPVIVEKPAFKKISDDSLKAPIEKAMKAAVEKALNKSSKIEVVRRMPDRKAPGFMILPSVVNLIYDPNKKAMAAAVSVSFWEMPKKSFVAETNGKGKATGVSEGDKAGYAGDLAGTLADGAARKALKMMESKAEAMAKKMAKA